MLSNLFTSSPSVWAAIIAGLVALPLLIHLINLVRHKTVEWAAMDFLLKSHRKNRNWVWLKQLFLMLSRVAAFLLALMMLSQIGCEENRIAALLGGRPTHHYVLLDDSFSMSDRDNEGSAFGRARSTLSLIAARARNRQDQRFTLLRFSAMRLEDSDSSTNSDVMSSAEINNELVDNAFGQRVEDCKADLSVSNFPASLDGAAEAVAHLIQQRSDQNAIVYVLSDFRNKDWQSADSSIDAFEEMRMAGAAVELIRCASEDHDNLAITNLEPAGNVRVAEAPLMMQVSVVNHSSEAAEKIQVKIASITFSDASVTVPADAVGVPDELPTVFIERIEAGQTETRSFPVYFNTTGKHVVRANLGADAIEIDNQRDCVVEIESAAEILIVDEADQIHGSYLALAMSPNLMTGIRPEVRTKDFLRDSDPEILQRFDVIFMCDIDQMDEVAVRNLEQFVSNGGGVAYFLGPRTSFSFYNNSLYKNGEGIFPVELEKVVDTPEQIDDAVPDISPYDHPVFAPVLGLKNSLLDLVQVRKLVAPTLEWLAAKPAQATIVATLRGDQDLPLAVEGRFGNGRTIAFLTTAGPLWNNWMRNATFPPILLLLEDYLAAGNYVSASRQVGETVNLEKSTSIVTPDVSVLVPGIDGTRAEFKMKLEPESQTLIGNISGSQSAPVNSVAAGIYDVWFQNLDASRSVERFALNVDTSESDIELAKQAQVLKSLEKAAPEMTSWDQFNPEPQQQQTSSLNRLLLILLIALLVGEQVLAYSASYHN